MQGSLWEAHKPVCSALKASSRQAATAGARFKTSPGLGASGPRSERLPETAPDGTGNPPPPLPGRAGPPFLPGDARTFWEGRERRGLSHAPPLPRFLGYPALAPPPPPLRAASSGVPEAAMRLTAALGISHGRLRRRLGFGPRSRLDLLRNLVTALVRHERIETTRARADEMRFYAEHLIEHAKRGDADPQTMRLADFWLTEKDLVPKLFQVLVPRFASLQGGYTRMVRIPKNGDQDRAERAVIEYKGNPLPPLPLPRRDGEKTLVNQLLKGYREELGSAV